VGWGGGKPSKTTKTRQKALKRHQKPPKTKKNYQIASKNTKKHQKPSTKHIQKKQKGQLFFSKKEVTTLPRAPGPGSAELKLRQEPGQAPPCLLPSHPAAGQPWELPCKRT